MENSKKMSILNNYNTESEKFLGQVLRSFPEISKVESIFNTVTQQDFIELVKAIIDTNDHDITQRFLYFLFLFRDMEHIQDYLNSKEFDIDLLEKFVFFVHGYYTINGYSAEWIFEKIFYFVNNERLLDLVLYSKFIANDKMLLFIILSEFNVDVLDKYFAHITDMNLFTSNFLKLPEEILRSIIAKNYRLFEYIMLIVSVSAVDEKASEDFYDKYRVDLDFFSKLNDLVEEYNKKYTVENEKHLPFHKRDMDRISFLVNMVRDLPDLENAIEYFYNENIIIDETEKFILKTIVSDPMYKYTFIDNKAQDNHDDYTDFYDYDYYHH
ncbi:MAG: hypothetical protein GY754_31165 [bacterium]|nr:hypothetical protein [bacterium]